jgi:hypothetical protein
MAAARFVVRLTLKHAALTVVARAVLLGSLLPAKLGW